jgi:hypothetical protein
VASNSYAFAECAALPRVGRPSRFRPELAEIAYRLCLLGLTDQQLAEALGIGIETYYCWKISYAEFREAVARKAEADADVAYSLYLRARGGMRLAKVKIFLGKEGNIVYAPYEEVLAPDLGAAKLWLLNRQPGRWRERRDVEVTGTLEHRVAQMTPEERRARLLQLQARAAVVIEATEVEPQGD